MSDLKPSTGMPQALWVTLLVGLSGIGLLLLLGVARTIAFFSDLGPLEQASTPKIAAARMSWDADEFANPEPEADAALTARAPQPERPNEAQPESVAASPDSEDEYEAEEPDPVEPAPGIIEASQVRQLRTAAADRAAMQAAVSAQAQSQQGDGQDASATVHFGQGGSQ